MADEISNGWSWEQNKAFEIALSTCLDDGNAYRWERIAAQVPGKSVEDVSRHFQCLEQDITRIDSGQVTIPNYSDKVDQVMEGCSRDLKLFLKRNVIKELPGRRLSTICGKGNWKRISREFVKERTPQQVASHAQKYYIHQNADPKNKKRSSIHDINTLEHIHGQCSITGEDIQLQNIYSEIERELTSVDIQLENIHSEFQMEITGEDIQLQNVSITGEDIQLENVYPWYQMEITGEDIQLQNFSITGEDIQLENVYPGYQMEITGEDIQLQNVSITGEDIQLENVYPGYQMEITNEDIQLENVPGGVLYAGYQMEGDEMRDAYAPNGMDNAFYLGNQTNDA